MNLCPRRVWDNGDMTDCGRLPDIDGMCVEHFFEHLKDVQYKIWKTQGELSGLQESEAKLRLAAKSWNGPHD